MFDIYTPHFISSVQSSKALGVLFVWLCPGFLVVKIRSHSNYTINEAAVFFPWCMDLGLAVRQCSAARPSFADDDEKAQ